MADLIKLHWTGQYAQLVEQHPDITAWHEEGVSHVIFPEGTRFEHDARRAKRPDVQQSNGGKARILAKITHKTMRRPGKPVQ